MAQQLSPLHEAVEADDLSRVQALVAAGADIEERERNNSQFPTPLWRAAEKGHVAVARYLVERGANKEATGSDGKTSLLVAAQQGHIEVVRMPQRGVILFWLGTSSSKGQTRRP